jgi:putative SOS response-associated peptidase YedK
MCSRLDAERDIIMRKFDIDAGSLALRDAKWGEIFPTDPALVVGIDNEPVVRRWGLMPDWAERPVINARVEEAAGKLTFRPLLNNRCIVPATGYYEWRVEDGGKIKTKIATDDILPIAGLLTENTFVIFTCAPSPAISHIHDRMPVILAEDAVSDWLNPDFDFADLRPSMIPYSDAPMAFADAEQTRVPRARPEPRQASLF